VAEPLIAQAAPEPDATIPALVACQRCALAPAESECCSSHQKHLCHKCYRVTHFVEVCSPTCSKCQREGLLTVISRG
jgi:hypothetical protein